jgi:hypothetical protein
MSSPDKNIVTRVFRNGIKPEREDWKNFTPAERIEGVWLLTKLCLGWNKSEIDEPRLQRTITRIQRYKR